MAAQSRKRSHSAKKHRPRGNPQKAKGATRQAVAPATARDWIAAARIRTLPLAITPVLIGTGAATLVDDRLHGVIALACLAVAFALQIGVNYANDYSDGVRGTDDVRVGPGRLTGGKKAKPRTVLIVALVFFALAAVIGLGLVIRTQQWWLIGVGALCIIAAWFYTGGKRPYGYNAMGELFVFVFFGLVATLGTTWVQVQSLPQEAWFGAVAAGLLACAVLLANNLRDIDQDRRAGKRTLSVLIGRRATQVLFTLFVLVPFAIAVFLALVYPVAWLTLIALLGGLSAILIVWTYRTPRELITALQVTSFTSVAYGALLFWAFAA
ncbi:1,4-dihydroxy-2-naphthoate polyprenyltransferase [Microbacterium trichothecenolyticum]|uniref:1,4-dihydroxy-2-naphthoate octaprenyltransferase n=1 Tax=Microbacterium trichothecenolyticum TaxID=69370 RepID=A0ABU0TY47_MICTR|nr:1,4-dihydroxy-2-naphthoate polyprenyltransferase [Microbacterium trichothecenolyticum]MDQ1124568.1 1,4-dihydroxy-2-naphthoate octaprenyltransferase [Microbacterium trichothecenolyticum]